MLFISEFKKAVAAAIPNIEAIATGFGDYVSIDIPSGMKYITEAGQERLMQILQAMTIRQSDNHRSNLDPWVVAPDMPVVTRTQNWQLETTEVLEILSGIDWLKANRLNMITWMSYVYELSQAETREMAGYSFSNRNYKTLDISSMRYEVLSGRSELDLVNRIDNSRMLKSLRLMRDIKITKDSYVKAVGFYNAMIQDLETHTKRGTASGMRAMFEKRPERMEASARMAVKESAIDLFDKIKNGLSSRTWGFEIEVPDAKGVDAPRGIEKGNDGSLRSENHEDCECDCNECAYHECNCDICEYGSDDPQHCGDDYCAGSADSAEYRSTGGIQRVLHVGMIELCDKLVEEDAEINSSAGTHIHVYAQDLSTNQVGQVLATYHWLYNNIFWPIAGRDNNQYAKPLNINDIANALRRHNPTLRAEKPLVVNVTNLLNGRGTIEFRHQNCNLDSKLISVWAWLVRGLVEVAKRGAKFTDFKKCVSLADMIAVYAKFNFTPESENPKLVITGSKSDEDRVEKVTHKVLTRS
jgi:hypothetical protein